MQPDGEVTRGNRNDLKLDPQDKATSTHIHEKTRFLFICFASLSFKEKTELRKENKTAHQN